MFHYNGTVFQSLGYAESYVEMSHCAFIDDGYATNVGKYALFTDNEIRNCDYGFRGWGGIIAHNLYLDCGYGIYLLDSASVYDNIVAKAGVCGILCNGGTINDNQVWYCKVGINYEAGNVVHNGFKYNDVGVICSTTSTANFRYNCIENSTSYAFKNGTSNVNMSNNYWGETDSSKI
ncbi:MAG: hypothetical protein ACTHKV_14160 [Flavipsychrobacter sp.]